MKIAIGAGGTGGHIYPALTLAESLKQKGHEVVFFGASKRMESEIIPKTSFEFVPLKVESTQGNIFNKIISLLSIFKSYFECKKLLKGYDLAIGFGNYISIPLILAAKKLKIKTVIHEQNSFAGKANLYLDEKVDLVIGSFKENLKQFKNPHTLILGNPQSQKAYDAIKDENIISEVGLDKNKKTVLIFMGSLGSESVNKILIDYFKTLDGTYQVIYATGKNYYQIVSKSVEETEYLKIFERVDGIKMMKASDLLISRAGATTLAEITSLGIPSILIPSPYVPNNHQYHNAKALVDKKAALLIEEKDLSASNLSKTIDSIINDDELLNELGRNAKATANPNVIKDIVKEIESL